jgi:hypothetical protein
MRSSLLICGHSPVTRGMPRFYLRILLQASHFDSKDCFPPSRKLYTDSNGAVDSVPPLKYVCLKL